VLTTLKINDQKLTTMILGYMILISSENTMKGNKWTQLILFTNKTCSDCSGKKNGKEMDIGFEV